MELLKDVRMIITDSACDLKYTVVELQSYIQRKDHLYQNRAWDQCFPQRFLVMPNTCAFLNLKKIVKAGSVLKQEETESLQQFPNLHDLAAKMTKACLFTSLIQDKFWQQNWSRTKIKQVCLKYFKPGQSWHELKQVIRANAQALIPNHRKVMVIWDMIQQTNELMDEHLRDQSLTEEIMLIESRQTDPLSLCKSRRYSEMLNQTWTQAEFDKLLSVMQGQDSCLEGQQARDQTSSQEWIRGSLWYQGRQVLIDLILASPERCLEDLSSQLGARLSQFMLLLLLDILAQPSLDCIDKKERSSRILHILIRSHTRVALDLQEQLIVLGSATIRSHLLSADGHDNAPVLQLLDAQSLIDLLDLFYQNQLIENTRKQKTSLLLFDLLLTMAYTDIKQGNVAQSHALLRAASSHLHSRLTGLLSSLSSSEASDLFNNTLIRRLFPRDQLNQRRTQQALLTPTGFLITALVTQLSQLYVDHKSRWPNLEFGVRLSPQLLRAQKLIRKIEAWQYQKDQKDHQFYDFDLWHDTKLSLLLCRESRNSQVDMGQLYESDVYCYNRLRFKKRIEAGTDDLLISINRNGSDQTVKITTETGTAIYVNALRIATLGPVHVTVKRSSWADLEIVDSDASVLFTGQLKLRNLMQSGQKWLQMHDYATFEPRIMSCGPESMFIVDRQDKVWGLGGSLKGRKDSGWASEVPKPQSCTEIVKVTQGKSFRVVLTAAGTLFVQGSGFKDVLKLNEPSCTCLDDQGCPFKEEPCAMDRLKEVDLKASFDELDPEDKIVDLAIGSVAKTKRNLMSIVTARGEALLIGADLVELLSHQNKHQRRAGAQRGDHLCRRLKLEKGPRGKSVNYKTKKVFMALDRTAFWLLVEDNQGKNHTLTAGLLCTGARAAPDDQVRQLTELENVPSDVYFTQIVATQLGLYALDSNKDLWLWKLVPADPDGIYYDEQHKTKGSNYPRRLKWMRDQGLVCTQIKAGQHACIVQTKSLENGQERLFGLVVPGHKKSFDLLGAPFTDVSDESWIIGLDNLGADQVSDFACTDDSSFVVLKKPEIGQMEESKTMGVLEKRETGLFYYFKDNDGWHKMKEGQESSLPPLCLATRHPITSFSDQEEWELNRVWKELSLLELGDNLDAPYFCSCTEFGDSEQRFEATEEQFIEGGQIWDLNPVVFYRFKKTLAPGCSPPKLNQAAIYKQDRTKASQISFQVRQKKISGDALEAALVQSTDETKHLLDQLQSMTTKDDKLILKIVEKQLQTRFPDARDFALRSSRSEMNPDSTLESLLECDFSLDISQFDISAQELPLDLQDKHHLVPYRLSMLLKLNMAFYKLFALLCCNNQTNTSYRQAHFSLVDRIAPTLLFRCVKNELVKVHAVDQSNEDLKVRVTVKEGTQEPIFAQVVKQLDQGCDQESGPLAIFKNHSVHQQPFIVGYEGVRVIDRGGPFRKVLSDIYEELRDGTQVKLLHQVDQEKQSLSYMVNARIDGDFDQKLLIYMGALLGYSFLTMSAFGVDFVDAFWKLLFGHRLSMADLAAINQQAFKELCEVHECAPETPCQRLQTNANDYFKEFHSTMALIRQGMDEVLGKKINAVAYLPLEAVKRRICGYPTISVESLRSIATYDCNEEDQVLTETQLAWFWQILEEFSPAQRTKFLIFVWAQDRLPAELRAVRFLINIQKQVEQKNKNSGSVTKWRTDSLPTASTCTFQLMMPFYSAKEKMKQQITMAMLNARGLDDEQL